MHQLADEWDPEAHVQDLLRRAVRVADAPAPPQATRLGKLLRD
ncbi:hypothetical protein [Kitasatospora brasiliensis]|nr:hypothetical protein [Kitasatospora sp. K002]